MMYGYARVSSKDQNDMRQILALQQAGVAQQNIFTDHLSGKDFNRPGFEKLLDTVKKGDVVFVKSIDRLGRNYRDILEWWDTITRKLEVDLCVIDMPVLDTRQSKNLINIFISDAVLQILSFVAETERANIRERQAEGIAAAKSRGVRFGRKEIPLPECFEEVYEKWANKEITGTEAAELCEMPLTTFLYKAKKYSR